MKKLSWWRWQDTAILLIGLCSIGFAVINYQRLPDQLPIHFNVQGEADRFGDKLSSLGLISAIALLLPFALLATKFFDPKRANYAKFASAYANIRLILALVFNFVLVSTVLYGLGTPIKTTQFALIAVGLLFFVLGNFMPQIKDNYFVGIRTPWTLNDPEVWRKTHRIGGKLWMLAGLIVVLGSFLPPAWKTAVILVAFIPLLIVPTVYSYLISPKKK
ncbi:SdpI family protein [Gorillibacterium sp. CAU 1737]|uniref:SdpI family protein n=1 Tax=Gorillibacterium sp. CAU 1737 TaxID=3140362 RepID=UPI003260541F